VYSIRRKKRKTIVALISKEWRKSSFSNKDIMMRLHQSSEEYQTQLYKLEKEFEFETRTDGKEERNPNQKV
jgi:hypothetical protein